MQELLILGVLLREKMHGYQLGEYVSHAMSPFTTIKKPTIYYTLDKLEKNGYVHQESEREGNRPERRVYEITNKGKFHFLKLLNKNLSDFVNVTNSNDIGIIFMNHLPTEELIKLLTEKREKIAALLAQFRQIPEHGDTLHYIVSRNIAHLEVDLCWAEGILEDLRET